MLHRFSQTPSDIVTTNAPLGYRSDIEAFHPLYQVHDINAKDIGTVRRIAKEMIYINGGLVKVHARTMNEDVDDIWDEDPDPTYLMPENFKAFFIPQPLEFELTQWGADVANNQTEIAFVLGDVHEKYGERLLRTGDLIEVPYNSVSIHQPKYYYVNNAQESGNFRYIWLYMNCQASLITGDVNIRPATDQIQLIGYEMPDNAVDHQ